MRLDVIYNEDCLEMKKLSNGSIDLIATDPPYGLKFMGKKWDQALPSIDIWKECLRVLKPGAFAFVMCIPRQDCLARVIVSLEDAGFIVSFTSIYWAYASGFPKAQNIGKVVDKKGRTILFFDEIRQMLQEYLKKSDLTIKQVNEHFGFATNGSGMAGHWFANISQQTLPTKKQYFQLKKLLRITMNRFDKVYKEIEEDKRPVIGEAKNWGRATESLGIGGKHWKVTLPYSKEAQTLDGSYGGFQPKPAVEVVIVAMKPLETKTYVDQALRNGKGISWLDEGRIPYKTQEDIDETSNKNRHTDFGSGSRENKVYGEDKRSRAEQGNYDASRGRFPANLLCSDDVLNDGRVTKSEGGKTTRGKEGKVGNWGYKQFNMQGYGDSGSFSRYFSLDAWFEKKLKELPKGVQKTFPFLIVPKASKAEKNRGCEGLEEKSNQEYDGRKGQNNSETRLDGSERKAVRAGNFHPTCKPIKLFSYLLTLGSRESDIVLDPFIGSGTTAIAASILGRHYIGFEINPEYCEIAKKRLSEVQLELI